MKEILLCHLRQKCFQPLFLAENLEFEKKGFSLVEMLMALLVASLLMAALAPVMTKRYGDSTTISIEGTIPGLKDKKHVINYNDDNCSVIDNDNNVCKGSFTVPNGFNGNMYVTLTGAGGGGGSSATTGSIEYTTAGSHSFKVPEGVNEIEITLVEGGAGGGAGWIDNTVKGYAWTFDGKLDRNYVSTSDVSENVKDVKVTGGSSVAANQSSYSHGTATLNGNDTKYIAGGKVFVTLAGGGGGGGRGFAGTGGGGGAARKRYLTTITNGTAYTVSVGSGGKGHACGSTVSAGCGGAESKFGGLVNAGGGGGGVHGYDSQSNISGTVGENGGAAGMTLNSVCASLENKQHLKTSTGGYGASPGGTNGGDRMCDATLSIQCQKGSDGGTSTFGKAGVYSYTSLDTRHGQGYGAGGCGGGAEGCAAHTDTNAGPDFIGDGAPGFVAAEWYDILQGGSGGGGGAMAVKQRIKVFPGETLTIVIGGGGKGGKKGIINGVGDITAPNNGESGRPSLLKRGETLLLITSKNAIEPGTGCGWGACGGEALGRCTGTGCSSGWVYSGFHNNGSGGFSCNQSTAINYTDSKNLSYNTNYPGYTVEGGFVAGNKAPGATGGTGTGYTGTLTADDKGGKGGQTVIDNKKFCTSGAGSTVAGTKGGNATGYGGCGGGGGYGLADGGDGAPGYAKIVWNPDKKGAGGGGGSGNTLVKRSISVSSGAVIGYQIGKGGVGGSISGNNTVDTNLNGTAFNNGVKGGDTTFGINSPIASNNFRIIAGGGYGGLSPVITGNKNDVNSIVLSNGSGGNKANICKIADTLLTCQGALDGKAGTDTKGGDGANSKNGLGGAGTSSNTGRDATPITGTEPGGGGGGGGSGVTESNTPSNNGNTGGNGANGQIVIEWKE